MVRFSKYIFISPIQMTAMIYPACKSSILWKGNSCYYLKIYFSQQDIYLSLIYNLCVFFLYGNQHINIYVMGIDLLNIFYKNYFYLIGRKHKCEIHFKLHFKPTLIKESKEELSCVKKSLSHFLSYCNFCMLCFNIRAS